MSTMKEWNEARELSSEQQEILLQGEMETASAYARIRLLMQCASKHGRSLAFLEAALPQCLREEGLGFDWLSNAIGNHMATHAMYMGLTSDGSVRFYTTYSKEDWSGSTPSRDRFLLLCTSVCP